MKKLEAVRNYLEIAIGSCFIASIFFYCGQYLCTQITVYGKDPIWFFVIQALSGILAIAVPYKLRVQKRINLSPLLYCFYLLFLFASLFLGELCHFYSLIPSWDTFLHFSSGFLLFLICKEWLQKNIFQRRIANQPALLILSVCLSLSIGGAWEIYEFISDSLLQTNMQRFLTIQGETLVGRWALMDTMTDLIFGLLGATLGAMYCVYEQKYTHKEEKQELKNFELFFEKDLS